MQTFRKRLSIPGLLSQARKRFERIPDKKKRRDKGIQLADCLMSGMAIFGLKYPSLLQFEQSGRHKDRENLKNLYGIGCVPSDSYFREELDEVLPEQIRPVFKDIYQELQRGKGLKRYEFLHGQYLVPIDGTGYFHSKKVSCPSCCKKEHRDGTVSYYHQMLGASIVHPECKEVIPLCPEPVIKEDGKKKNDCELNASKRLIERLREDHPKLPMIIVEDALYGNGPHIELLKSKDFSFIIGVKPKSHEFLFDWVARSNTEHCDYTDEKGVLHRFRYLNNVPLNGATMATCVNFLEYWEIKKNKTTHFTWITDLQLNDECVYHVMRGGRARWKIENETFNTLKNQGYQFEHNFGHGKKHLSTVMAYLMMLAFLIDQIQAFSCDLFQSALESCWNKKSCLWERIRSVFFEWIIPDWDSLYAHISRPNGKLPIPNSS